MIDLNYTYTHPALLRLPFNARRTHPIYRLNSKFVSVRMCFCSSESIAYASLSIASFSSSRLGRSSKSGIFSSLLKKSIQTVFFKYLRRIRIGLDPAKRKKYKIHLPWQLLLNLPPVKLLRHLHVFAEEHDMNRRCHTVQIRLIRPRAVLPHLDASESFRLNDLEDTRKQGAIIIYPSMC